MCTSCTDEVDKIKESWILRCGACFGIMNIRINTKAIDQAKVKPVRIPFGYTLSQIFSDFNNFGDLGYNLK